MPGAVAGEQHGILKPVLQAAEPGGIVVRFRASRRAEGLLPRRLLALTKLVGPVLLIPSLWARVDQRRQVTKRTGRKGRTVCSLQSLPLVAVMVLEAGATTNRAERAALEVVGVQEPRERPLQAVQARQAKVLTVETGAPTGRILPLVAAVVGPEP